MTFGGAGEDRTLDLLHAKQALSQLSYGPITKSIIARRGESVKCFLFHFPVRVGREILDDVIAQKHRARIILDVRMP